MRRPLRNAAIGISASMKLSLLLGSSAMTLPFGSTISEPPPKWAGTPDSGGKVMFDIAGDAVDAELGKRITETCPGAQFTVHMIKEIKERYGFRDFGDAPFERFRLTRWLHALCQAGDERPGLLMDRAVAWLLAERVLLPGVSTLERFCARIRARVRERRWTRMAHAA